MAKNVLITGANGFLGKYIVKEFIKDGNYHITATDVPGTKFLMGVYFVEADIRDRESLELLAENKDLIVNVAGLVDLGAEESLLNSINHEGVKNICEAALEEKVEKLIQISSISVYGTNEKIPIYEDDEKKPDTNYGKSKWLGEQEAFKYSKFLDVIAIRPSAVYGIGSSQTSTLPILNMSKNLLYFKKSPLLSHVHAEDVARAVVFLAGNPDAAGEAYNLADDRPLTGSEMVKALAEPLGLEIKDKLPYNKRLLKAINFIAQKLPKSFYQDINKQLRVKWSRFVGQNGLRDGLEPRIDPTWLDYLIHNQVYSNKKIKELGFEFKHNDAEKGLREVVERYIKRGFLRKNTKTY